MNTTLDTQERRLQHMDTDFKVPDNITPYPLKSPSQQIVLLNLAHKQQRPVHELPAFRILGLFASKEEAAVFSAEHYTDSKESVFACPVHQLVPICKSHLKQLDNDYCQETVNSIIALHEDIVKHKDEDFKNTVDDQRTGSVGSSVMVTREKTRLQRAKSSRVQIVSEKFKNRTVGFEKVGSTLTANKVIAKQSFAVVVVLQDIRKRSLYGDAELEPLVAVMFATDTHEEATTYAKYTAAKIYKDCTIDIVDLYQWGFPESIDHDSITKEEYGNDELTGIMNARRANQEKILEYEKWFEENKRVDGVNDVVTTIDHAPEQIAAGSELVPELEK
jgi:hypothetical protein